MSFLTSWKQKPSLILKKYSKNHLSDRINYLSLTGFTKVYFQLKHDFLFIAKSQKYTRPIYCSPTQVLCGQVEGISCSALTGTTAEWGRCQSNTSGVLLNSPEENSNQVKKKKLKQLCGGPWCIFILLVC